MAWYNEIVSSSLGRTLSIGTDALTNVWSSNPSLARLDAAGLPFGGSRSLPPSLGNPDINFSSTGDTRIKDWRVRVSTTAQALAYAGVMTPLNQTKGVIFPNTPQITVTHQANYTPQKFTHSNYAAFAYENSEVQTIQINADFTIQNSMEASYLLACIYFFRTATKMFFGQGNNVGNPPPMVFLDGYGTHYFPHVPCLVTQFTHTMPSEVDYIVAGAQYSQDAKTGNSSGSQFGNFANGLMNTWSSSANAPTTNAGTRMPTISTLSVALQPVYSKNKISGFDLERFGRGELTGGGFL